METTNLCPLCTWVHTKEIRVNNRPHLPNAGGKRIRAGVFMYNPKERKLLVVQAYNQFIGLPKGGVEVDETLKQAAIRETKEESGVTIDPMMLHDEKSIRLHGSATYFVIETDTCLPVSINNEDGNDVTGAGWIHLECLRKIPGRCTSHLETMVKRVLNVDIMADSKCTAQITKDNSPVIRHVPQPRGKLRHPPEVTVRGIRKLEPLPVTEETTEIDQTMEKLTL